MGLHIECKFGPKKRGGFRVPVYFIAEANEEELNPFFALKREYNLPGQIFADPVNAEKLKTNISCCRTSDKLTVNISSYASFKITEVKMIANCGCYGKCHDCKICLPWRPGAHPDYSDFEQVFQQIANDIRVMYETAVAEALASEEIAQYDVVVFDSSQEIVLSQKSQDIKSKPQRKVRV